MTINVHKRNIPTHTTTAVKQAALQLLAAVRTRAVGGIIVNIEVELASVVEVKDDVDADEVIVVDEEAG